MPDTKFPQDTIGSRFSLLIWSGEARINNLDLFSYSLEREILLYQVLSKDIDKLSL